MSLIYNAIKIICGKFMSASQEKIVVIEKIAIVKENDSRWVFLQTFPMILVNYFSNLHLLSMDHLCLTKPFIVLVQRDVSLLTVNAL